MSSDLLKHAAEIVEAYVSNNEIHAKELPGLLKEVFEVLTTLASGKSVEGVREESSVTVEEAIKPAALQTGKKRPEPFVAIDQAVSDDVIICLICGKSCKAIKGHLTRSHKIDFDQYRKMFDLDKSFPMVAPNYSKRRRSLAIEAGLGDKLRESRKQALLNAG